MTQVVVARMLPPPVLQEEIGVSVVIPCKNERGNVEDAVRRIPPLAGRTELLFCDDQSTDGTAEEVLRVQSLYPEKNIRLEHGPGVCKSRNVWTGFDAATGDILMILDADLTTIPRGVALLRQCYRFGTGGVCQWIAPDLPRTEGSNERSKHAR